MIDSQQASAALDDINDVVRRVRQSQIYQLSSLIIVIWGVLVFAAYIANYIWPRQGYAIWTVANLIGLVVTIAIGVISNVRPGAAPSDPLIDHLPAYRSIRRLLLGHTRPFGPRQMIVFWALWHDVYALAGLWFGYAFIGIAVSP